MGEKIASSGTVRLAEALHRIPEEEKRAYHEALATAPEIVAVESSPNLFLMAEDNDATRAAQRLVSYWNYRRKVYSERAHLPLVDTSGKGALSTSDIQVLRSGIGYILPNDDSGRIVLCFDDSCTLPDISLDPLFRIRCFLYLLTTAALRDSRAQTEGIVFLLLGSRPIVDTAGFLKSLSMFVDAAPIKIYCCHFCSVSLKGVPNMFLETYAPSANGFVKLSSRGEHRDAVAKLRDYGMSVEGLPEKLGGSWVFDSSAMWPDRVVDTETSTEDETHQSKFASTHPRRNNRSKSRREPDEAIDGTLIMKRQRNARYSHKFRRRLKEEESELQLQYSKVFLENAKLKEENAKLEQMLVDAESQISKLDGLKDTFALLPPRQGVMPPVATTGYNEEATGRSGSRSYAAASIPPLLSKTWDPSPNTPPQEHGVDHTSDHRQQDGNKNVAMAPLRPQQQTDLSVRQVASAQKASLDTRQRQPPWLDTLVNIGDQFARRFEDNVSIAFPRDSVSQQAPGAVAGKRPGTEVEHDVARSLEPQQLQNLFSSDSTEARQYKGDGSDRS